MKGIEGGLPKQRTKLFWPYFIGSDNPIPYLFEKIAPHFEGLGFEIRLFSEQSTRIIEEPFVEEVFAYEPNTLRRRLRVVLEAVRHYHLLHTGGNPEVQLPIAKLTHLRNDELQHVHTFRIDHVPGEDDDRTKRELVDAADAYTAVSQHTRETVTRALDIDPRVIYNAVDVDLFRPDYEPPESVHAVDFSRPLFLYVGTLTERKRPKHVVEVAREVPEAKFVLIGDGPQYDAVKRESEDVPNAVAIGRHEKRKLPPLYANATGFVFPSVREGCPNVVLEAMASETPVVGYRATSMPELVRDGETGRLAAKEDTDELTDCVRALMDEDKNESLGTAAREYVLQNHTFDIIAEQYISLYRDLLAGT